MNKIIMLIMETCSLKQLTEIMIEYSKHFESILKLSFKKARESEDPNEFYMLVKEK